MNVIIFQIFFESHYTLLIHYPGIYLVKTLSTYNSLNNCNDNLANSDICTILNHAHNLI